VSVSPTNFSILFDSPCPVFFLQGELSRFLDRSDQIAKVHIDRRENDREDHQRESDLKVADEADAHTAFGCHSRHDEVRGRADEGAVAAETCAECERPPERLEVLDAHRAHVLDERDHRCNERNVVEHRGDDGAHPEDEQRRRREVAARCLHCGLREPCDDADLDQPADSNEEPDEEEDRRPLDRVHRLFHQMLAPACEEEQQEAARQCDERRLDVRKGMREKSEDREPQDEERALQQAVVRDRRLLIHLHELLLQRGRRDKAPAVGRGHDEEHDHHADDRDRRKILDERNKSQFLHGTADHDVRRIADERRRAADVRRDDLCQEIRHRIELQDLCDAECHRYHEEYGGHIVEERGEHRRDDAEIDEDAPRLRLCRFCRLDRDVVKEPRLLRHADEHHHADEESERLKVHMMQRRLLRKNAEQHHKHCADHRRDRSVDLLRNDHHIHHDKDNSSQCFHASASFDGGVVFRRQRFLMPAAHSFVHLITRF